MSRKLFIGMGLLVLLMVSAAWNTKEARSKKRVFLNISAADVYYFPTYGTANMTTLPSAAGLDSLWHPTFVSISRYFGSDVGTFVVYSEIFDGGSDTVFSGDIIVDVIEGAKCDSIEAVSLGTSLWQIEASN